MYTQCPYCQTLFQISTEQLLTANGKAHCCRCDRIFNARENLHEATAAVVTSAGQGDSDTRIEDAPWSVPRWSEPAPWIETSSATRSGEESSDRVPNQEAEPISVSHPFEQVQYDGDMQASPEAESSKKAGPQPSGPVPSLTIEPFRLDDQGQFPPCGGEEIGGSIPELGALERHGTDDAIPGFLADPATPEESGPEAWQSEPEARPEPVFGPEFLGSQLQPAELGPLAPDPADIAEEIPAAQEYKDRTGDQEASPQVADLLQEREPLEDGAQSGHSSQDGRREKAPEPPLQVPDDLPAIEPSQRGSLYPEERLTTPGHGKSRHFAWSLSLVVLLLLALGQTAWLGRDRLLQYPATRELLDAFCRLAGCQLPERRAPDQLKILSRSVTSHRQIPNALQILLTISNQARFSQPYPQIQLSLFNTKDELLARRRFRPDEYLEPVAGGYPLLRPERPVQLEILLQDPGEEATGFEFEFF